MGQQFDARSVERIVRSVLHTERTVRTPNVGVSARSTMLTPFGIVRGRVVSAPTTGTDAYIITLDRVTPLGQDAPKPLEPLRVVNVPRAGVTVGDWALAIYRHAAQLTGTPDTGTGTGDGNWELLVAATPTGTSVAYGSACMITETIPAAVLDGILHTGVPGKLLVGTDFRSGGVVLVRLNSSFNIIPVFEEDPLHSGTGTAEMIKARRTAVNVSYTPIRASSVHPLVGLGSIIIAADPEGVTGTGTGGSGTEYVGTGTHSVPEELEVFLINNIMDFRGLPGFAVTTGSDILIPYFPTGEQAVTLDAAACGTGSGT